MNNKDKKHFNLWVENYPSDHFDDWGVYELMKYSWQSACRYKNKELTEWKEASRSEADEVNRLQAENKKLREALEKIKDYGTIIYDGEGYEVYSIAREALKEVGEK